MAKASKKSAWRTPNLSKNVDIKYMIENGLEPEEIWDDYVYKDGLKDGNIRDGSKFRIVPKWGQSKKEEIEKRNLKLKILQRRRIKMKNKTRLWSNGDDISLPTRETGFDSWQSHQRVTSLSSGLKAGVISGGSQPCQA